MDKHEAHSQDAAATAAFVPGRETKPTVREGTVTVHDSGWIAVDNTTNRIVPIRNALGSLPFGTALYFSPDTETIYAHDLRYGPFSINPSTATVSEETLSLTITIGYTMYAYNDLSGVTRTYPSGYWKLIYWGVPGPKR
jgi:hypothetical protein